MQMAMRIGSFVRGKPAAPHGQPGKRALTHHQAIRGNPGTYSIAFTMSSTTFLASPNTIIVLSM
jgi:hypothetical protein